MDYLVEWKKGDEIEFGMCFGEQRYYNKDGTTKELILMVKMRGGYNVAVSSEDVINKEDKKC